LIYLDTSVVVAYYCPEALSERAERIVRLEPEPAISNLTRVEFLSALARKKQDRELSGSEASRISAEFEKHVRDGLYRLLPLEHDHFERARNWLQTLDAAIRTLDALHLALAAEREIAIATADRVMARHARRLGIALVEG
jgi:predicted nucleic acid-binding protein